MRITHQALSLLLVAPQHVWGRLVKVIGLARHGNRAPNAQFPYVCPLAEPFLGQWHEPIGAKQKAALSHVGMAENGESGKFLLDRYRGKKEEGKLLPAGPYYDDGSTFFFSERMNRNVMSTIALTQGMFPPGSGQEGYRANRPNYVPILTSQPFHDTMMNLPRDGPCKKRYNADRKWFADNREPEILEENRPLIEEFGRVCGFNFTVSYEGKTLNWLLKAAADGFHMAKNEGIDTSMVTKDAKSAEVVDKVIELAGTMTNENRFGSKEKIVYWAGSFLEKALFANLRKPSGKKEKKESLDIPGWKGKSSLPWSDSPEEFFETNRFLLFLNHRELVVAVSSILGLTELTQGTPPSGSMILWELHENDSSKGDMWVEIYFWKPSSPSFEKKHEYLKNAKNVDELYSLGQVEQLKPLVCANPLKCKIEELEVAYQKLVDEVGDWKEVCGMRSKKGGAKGQLLMAEYAHDAELLADDGDDENGYQTALEKNIFTWENAGDKMEKAEEKDTLTSSAVTQTQVEVFAEESRVAESTTSHLFYAFLMLFSSTVGALGGAFYVRRSFESRDAQLLGAYQAL